MTAFGPTTYTWDTLDRLKTRIGAGVTYTFTYDGQDRRTAIDHESTKFIYQGLNAVDMSYRKDGGYYPSNYLRHRRTTGTRRQHGSDVPLGGWPRPLTQLRDDDGQHHLHV